MPRCRTAMLLISLCCFRGTNNLLFNKTDVKGMLYLSDHELVLINKSGILDVGWGLGQVFRTSRLKSGSFDQNHRNASLECAHGKKINIRGKREVQMMERWIICPVHFLLCVSLWNPSQPHPSFFHSEQENVRGTPVFFCKYLGSPLPPPRS